MLIKNKKISGKALVSLLILSGCFFLITSAHAATATTTCASSSKLFLTLKNFSGALATGLKYEVYEQQTDFNGLPLAGPKIGGGTWTTAGQAALTFKPYASRSYALKIWDKRQDLGEFWFYDSARFVCGYDRYITKTLPALKVILRDSQNKLKRNYAFSLYTQRYDADGKPFYENSDLIANLKTDGGGQTIVYLAPYNPYQANQSGLYVITSKDANNNNSVFYNVQIPENRDYTFQYIFSSLSGEVRDARRKLQTNREVRLYEQTNDGGGLELGKQLTKVKTGTTGRFQLDYPAGTYALVVLDDYNRENIFWNIIVKAKTNNSKKIVTSAVKFGLTDALNEGISKDASIKLYTLTTDDGHNYYRDKEVGNLKLSAYKTAYSSLAAGYYLAVYTGKGSREYGRYFKATNGQLTTVNLTVSAKAKVDADTIFKIK